MTRFKARCGASAIAMAAVLTGGLAATPALAQTQPAAQASLPKRHFSIAAGPLAPALSRFAEVTGIQLVYPSALVQGLSSPGLSGDFAPGEALQRLLGGTGLTARMLSATSATLEPPPVAGARTLGAVQVEGVQSDAFVALDGFGAGAGGNGSSDPTATEGTGSLTTNGASVASKAPLALKDTPQSVSVITSERIEQQNLTDMTSALEYTPGVTLADTTALETTFYSRGFQITTFQLDGGGSLNLNYHSYNFTTPNLAEFDNIQVLRGSDALFGGTGQPSGVVSLDRKRPLDHDQVTGEVDVGSWDNYQAQVDLTGPIAFDGHLRARVVLTDQDRHFFYETAQQEKAFAYGVVEADLGPQTILRVGGSFEKQDNSGYNVNGLPRYSDGGDLDLPRSTNLSPPWAHWNFSTPEVFATLEHRFNSDWGLKVDFTRLGQSSASKYDLNANNIVRSGTTPYPYGVLATYQYSYGQAQYSADATLNGSFELFGLKQALTLGMDYSLTRGNSVLYMGSANIPINVFSFNPSSLAEPAQPALNSVSPLYEQAQWGEYVTLNVQPIKNLHVSGGVRVSTFTTDTVSDLYFGHPTPLIVSKSTNTNSGILTPYGAATYGVTSEVSLYASYADIYQVQPGEFDRAGKPLPPVTGATYEAGVKGAFKGGKLNASLGFYYTDASNQSLFTTTGCLTAPSCYLDEGGQISEGADLEVSGEILPGWQAQAGYSYNTNRYNQAYLSRGEGFPTFQSQQPAHQIKLWTSYTPTGRLDRWTVGGGFRLESERFTRGTQCNVEPIAATGACPTKIMLPFAYSQPLYTVLDLRAAYKLNSHWQAALEVTNVGDTRYYTTAGTLIGQNFYGEPRAFMFSLRAKY